MITCRVFLLKKKVKFNPKKFNDYNIDSNEIKDYFIEVNKNQTIALKTYIGKIDWYTEGAILINKDGRLKFMGFEYYDYIIPLSNLLTNFYSKITTERIGHWTDGFPDSALQFEGRVDYSKRYITIFIMDYGKREPIQKVDISFVELTKIISDIKEALTILKSTFNDKDFYDNQKKLILLDTIKDIE